jgi:hypothetical protein
VGRLAQSTGADLGSLGLIWRRAKGGASLLLRTAADQIEFAGRRSALTASLEALAKALTEAAPSVTKPQRFDRLSKYLTELVEYGKKADDYDFLRVCPGTLSWIAEFS